MTKRTRVAFWAIAGVLAGLGFTGLFGIGLPLLVAGLVMGLFGVVRLGFDESWAAVTGFGMATALVFLVNIIAGVLGFGAFSGSLVFLFILFLVVALLGVGARVLRDRGRPLPVARWLVGAVVGAVAAVLATVAIGAILGLIYVLISQPLGGGPAGGPFVGLSLVAISLFLAYLAGGYVAAKMSADAPGTAETPPPVAIGALTAILGMSFQLALAAGPVLYAQRGALIEAIILAVLAIVGGALGGYLGGRSNPQPAQPAGE